MKYTKKDIQEDPLLKEFIYDRTIKHSTEEIYIIALTYYCNLIEKTPSMFIEEAEDEEDQGLRPRRRKLRQYLTSYKKHLEERNLSPATVEEYLSRVRAIYRQYEITLPRQSPKKKNEDNVSMEQLPTLEDINNLLSIAGPRDKAIILTHMSSGMGSAEVRELNYQDFIDALKDYQVKPHMQLNDIKSIIEDENAVGTWHIKRVKTGMPYITFTTPECNKAIIDYLEFATKRNIKITPETPLFMTRSGRRLTKVRHTTIFRRLNDRLDYPRRRNGRRFFTSHQLRKMFTSTLYRAGLDKLMIDWMLGHKINPITESYFKSKPSDLKEKYLQVMKNLTLETVKYRKVTSEEIKKIVRDNEELRTEQDKMRKTLDELVIFAKENPEEFVSMVRENKK